MSRTTLCRGQTKTSARSVSVYALWMVSLVHVTRSFLPSLDPAIQNSVHAFSQKSSGRWPSHRYRLIHSTSVLQLNRFLFDPEEVQDLTSLSPDNSADAHHNSERSLLTTTPTVVLPKDDYRTIHAATILKLCNGDCIRAGIVGSRSNSHSVGQYTDQATIEWIPESPVKKAEVLANGKPPGPLKILLANLTAVGHSNGDVGNSTVPVSLILALPRPLQLGRILPMISQLGVDHLVLTSAQKVPKDYFGSHLFRKPQVLREKLIEGLCQSGDVILPHVHVCKSLNHFLEHDLDTIFPREEFARVVAHPQRKDEDQRSPLRMRQVLFPTVLPQPSKIVIAVGPEGGWAEPEELDILTKQHSFQQVTMGSRTLRTDCAVVSLLTLAHELCHERNIGEVSRVV
jgi:RsmE family RNA methyltransferase